MEGITWPSDWPEDPRPELPLPARNLLESLPNTERDLGGVARATVRVHYEDNDLFVSGNGANASQITVKGTVTDESGQEYHLTSFSHQVLAPGSSVTLQSKVKIQLTPIGG